MSNQQTAILIDSGFFSNASAACTSLTKLTRRKKLPALSANCASTTSCGSWVAAANYGNNTSIVPSFMTPSHMTARHFTPWTTNPPTLPSRKLPNTVWNCLNTRRKLAPSQALEHAQNGDTIRLQLDTTQAEQLPQAYRFWQSLRSGDVNLGLCQKGMDMRIATDIASIILKKQACTIVLIAGDGDFVPAAKLARREGMELTLAPVGKTSTPTYLNTSTVCNPVLTNPTSPVQLAPP